MIINVFNSREHQRNENILDDVVESWALKRKLYLQLLDAIIGFLFNSGDYRLGLSKKGLEL